MKWKWEKLSLTEADFIRSDLFTHVSSVIIGTEGLFIIWMRPEAPVLFHPCRVAVLFTFSLFCNFIPNTLYLSAKVSHAGQYVNSFQWQCLQSSLTVSVYGTNCATKQACTKWLVIPTEGKVFMAVLTDISQGRTEKRLFFLKAFLCFMMIRLSF